MNYFWLVADIPVGATVLDSLDATCDIVNITDNFLSTTLDYPTNVLPSVGDTIGKYVIKAILNGDYTVGTGGDFSTITAAVASLNDVGVSGPVRFLLTDAAYDAGETFPITLIPYQGASPTNTVTIKPNVAAVTISGSSLPGIFVLNGADYITIDGSVGNTANTICPPSAASRNLTINNTSTSTSSAVVWIQSTATDSATNNTVKNCNIVGNSNTTTLFGIGSGGTTVSNTSAPAHSNNNNSIINNRITKVQNGIYSGGISITRRNTGTVVRQNLINGTGADAPNVIGILVRMEDGIDVSGNTVANINSSGTRQGISLGNTSTNTFTPGTLDAVVNATVSFNTVTNINTTGGTSSFGIVLSPATTGTSTISNNVVAGITGNATPSDMTAGIHVGGGAGSTTRVYHNSVNMASTVTTTNTRTTASYALSIGGSSANPIVDVKNNILVNTSVSSGTNGNSMAIGLGYAAPFTNLTCDNNNFFVTNAAKFFVGSVTSLSTTGVTQLTLANWQATTGKDAASKNISPAFTSATDLHLLSSDATTVTNLVGTGAVTSVTTDIDCETRAVTPTIGADELVPCAGAMVDTAVAPVTNTFCGGAAAVGAIITASGYSTSWVEHTSGSLQQTILPLHRLIL